MSQDAIQPIPRQRYYDNQVLFAADFDREQSFASAHRELQTRLLFTPGVLAGLAVTPGAPGTVVLAPGAAVDAAGRAILLADRATLGGAALAATGGGFTIDLSALQWQGTSWTLTLSFAEAQDPANAGRMLQLPTLALDPEGAAPGAGEVALARLAVSRPAPPPVTNPVTPPTPPTVTIDASVATPVTLAPARLPALDAARIATGTLDPERIPGLDAAKIASGTLDPARIPVFDAASIPPLDAGKIATGVLDTARVPELDAAKLGSGVLDPARIPPLDAAAVATGTLAVDRIPDLPASKIVGGVPGGGPPVVWARQVAFWPVGLGIGSRTLASGGGSFFVGLLKTDTDQGRSYYALGIGFPAPILAFEAPEAAAAGAKLDVYPDRTRYALAAEGGAAGEGLVRVRFVGVAPELGFDLHTPEAELPPASRGKIASVVVIGSRLADPAATPPVSASTIVDALRDAFSPFTFTAVGSPDATPAPDPAAVAAEMKTAGWIAADAAPLLAALEPGGYETRAPALAALLTATFPDSTATPAQLAWSLAAGGVSAGAGSAALGQAFQGKATLAAIGQALAGAWPPPSVQQLVITLQSAGRAAIDAAPSLRAASPQFATAPLPLGVVLRVAFAETANTPALLGAALQAAGYTDAAAVAAAVTQLFPGSTVVIPPLPAPPVS